MSASATGPMDPHEKLKVARIIKEEGNAYHKRGKLPEAQKSYTKVLDMLREEITFTGDDQKKEKESLILAAHLNLAQCALQVGDYEKVIDHCNTALGLDGNNVKAHFRKAKAFQNLSEYAKASEGYQTVLRLEPNNSAAQKQLCECEKKFARESSMQQMSDNTGVIEVEMVHESCEAEFETLYKKCKKNRGHEEFIDVADFQIEHLPSNYRDKDLFDYVKHQIQLTVLMEVKGSSEHRPEYDPISGDKYPFSGKRYRKATHRGTGCVILCNFHEGDKLCPCTTCQSSGLPEKRWAEIAVATARHVVYDEIEASNTSCYFFFDTNIPLESCPRISNAADATGSEFDNMRLTFLSHDQKLIDFLDKELKANELSWYKIDTKFNHESSVFNNESSVIEGTEILDKFTQTVQRVDQLLRKLHDVINRFMAILEGDPKTEFQKCLEKRRKTGVFGILSKMLSNKLNGEKEFERYVKEKVDCTQFDDQLTECKKLLFNVNEIRHGILPLTEQIKEELWVKSIRLNDCGKSIKIHLDLFSSFLADDDDFPAACMDHYNSAHPITIIVSHPHGCSKKVSIGEVIDWPVLPSNLRRFRYSTPTCPGSSGAFVFIVGLNSASGGTTHSCAELLKSDDKQRNMSVIRPI